LSVYWIQLPRELKDGNSTENDPLAFDVFSKTKEGNLHLHGVFWNEMFNMLITYQVIQSDIFYPLVGGHLTFERVHLTIPKRSL